MIRQLKRKNLFFSLHAYRHLKTTKLVSGFDYERLVKYSVQNSTQARIFGSR